MKKGKVLHLGSAGKFVASHYRMLEDSFDIDQHEFYLIDGMASDELIGKSNVKIFKPGLWSFISYMKIILCMLKSRKIFLHGLNDPRIILIMSCMPFVLDKAYWIIWGSDLYQYKLKNDSRKSGIKECIRRPVIKNMGHLVTYIPGDVELARRWYGAKGQYHECLMYQSNVVDLNIIQAAQAEMEEHSGLNILVGNSADPSNNHMESLEKLLPYKNEDIKIFVPLSYGDQVHAKKVIEKGNECFGDKFIPLTSFMAFDEYLKFLKSIDIAIFNHKRQQAMGNTITLLGIGKTVYIRSDVSQWFLFKQKNITCLDVENFNKNCISSAQANNNLKKCLDYFNAATLLHQYSKIFKL